MLNQNSRPTQQFSELNKEFMITRMYVKIYLHISYSNNLYQPCVSLWYVHVVHLA